MTHDDLAAHARAIIETNRYLTPRYGRRGRTTGRE
jgi:hypothetical protein